MLDVLLIFSLGFLGSFGHCLGMCGPLTVAFGLSSTPSSDPSAAPKWQQQLRFNLLLNLGRIASYALVGLAIGSLGSVLIAGGQLAGIGSNLRQVLTIATGLMLSWFGLVQINPRLLPALPHPLQGHNWLDRLMTGVRGPLPLGLLWGLMPCGFLYAAQIKAAESGQPWLGALTMVAFGLGTLPMMMGVGVFSAGLSADRKSQLFRAGGWVTLAIGMLTLLRNSEMVDYTGHGALLLLIAALVARPIGLLWAAPLRYRRALGVGAFLLTLAHIAHSVDHTLAWNLAAVTFMLPTQQVGMATGALATLLLAPAAGTSFDAMVRRLGSNWRRLHLLALPALILAVLHTLLLGSSYLGGLALTPAHWLRISGLALVLLAVVLVRLPGIWSLLGGKKFYAAPKNVLKSVPPIVDGEDLAGRADRAAHVSAGPRPDDAR
jgi:uncharacterized protein